MFHCLFTTADLVCVCGGGVEKKGESIPIGETFSPTQTSCITSSSIKLVCMCAVPYCKYDFSRIEFKKPNIGFGGGLRSAVVKL